VLRQQQQQQQHWTSGKQASSTSQKWSFQMVTHNFTTCHRYRHVSQLY
jgi:hypothetical protein